MTIRISTNPQPSASFAEPNWGNRQANGIVRQPKPPGRPAVLIPAWADALRPSSPGYKPQPGRPAPSSVVLEAPWNLLRDAQVPKLSKVLARGSSMRAATGVPRLEQPLKKSAAASEVERALNPKWFEQFNALSDPQKEVALGLLAAVVAAAQKPTWQDGWLATKDIGRAVALVLDNARGQEPAQPVIARPRPGPTSVEPLPQAVDPTLTLPRAVDPGKPGRAALPEAVSTQPSALTERRSKPVVLTPVQKIARQLTLDFNVNADYTLRSLGRKITNGSLDLGRYDIATTTDKQVEVVQKLFVSGIQKKSAAQFVQLADLLGVDSLKLAKAYIGELNSIKAAAKSASPTNPLAVTERVPSSINNAVSFLTATLAQSESVKPTQRKIDGNVTYIPGGLLHPAVVGDIDGMHFWSYNERVADIPYLTEKGQQGLVSVRIKVDEDLLSIESMKYEKNAAHVSFVLRVVDAQGTEKAQTVQVQLDPDEVRALSTAKKIEGARLFQGLEGRNGATGTWDFMEKTDARQAIGRDGVKFNQNTFGAVGTLNVLDQTQSAALETSILRSLPPERTLRTPGEDLPALFSIQNIKTWSGGTHRTSEGQTVPVGLSRAQAAGLQTIAKEIPRVINELAAEFGLSPVVAKKMLEGSFPNADIPSVMIHPEAVKALGSRLPAFQQRLEARLVQLMRETGVDAFATIHHTPPGPGDTLLLAKIDNQGNILPSAYTSELQVTVFALKGYPMLDLAAATLRDKFGFDLMGELARRNFSVEKIRSLRYGDFLNFLSKHVRPIIQQVAGPKGLGTIVIGGDTITTDPITGKPAGSDVTMIEPARRLWNNVEVIQNHTFQGKKGSNGREGFFVLNEDGSFKNGPMVASIYTETSPLYTQLLNETFNNLERLSPDEWSNLRINSSARQTEKKTDR